MIWCPHLKSRGSLRDEAYHENGISLFKKKASMISLHYAGLDVHKETIDVFVYRNGEQRVPNEKKYITQTCVFVQYRFNNPESIRKD